MRYEEIPDLAKYLPDEVETADLVSKTVPPTKCVIKKVSRKELIMKGVNLDMTLGEFLDYLTDWNWHTERVLVETIMLGDDELINRACRVRLKHSEDGYLTDENGKERKAIIDEMERR